jgi:hypothetical protein
MALETWFLLLIATPALGVGPSASEATEAIRARFSHARTKVSEVKWRPSNFGEGCPRLEVTAEPVVMLDVRSPDSKIFGSVSVYVERLARDLDGYAHVLALGKGQPRGFDNCGFVSKSPIALIQLERLWVTVRGHCYDGGLFPYEVAEVLQALATLPGGSEVDRFLHAPCGRGFPTTVETRSFLEKDPGEEDLLGQGIPEGPGRCQDDDAPDEPGQPALKRARPPSPSSGTSCDNFHVEERHDRAARIGVLLRVLHEPRRPPRGGPGARGVRGRDGGRLRHLHLSVAPTSAPTPGTRGAPGAGAEAWGHRPI